MILVGKKLSKTTVSVDIESELAESDLESVDVESELAESYLESDSEPGVPYVDSSEAISSLNQCLAEIGETPYVKQKAHQRHYPEQKIKKITDAMKRTLITDTDCDHSFEDDGEIIEQLKRKLELSTSKSEQLQILTVLPQSWTCKKIQDVF